MGYLATDILMVRHTTCTDCDAYMRTLVEKDVPIELPMVTLGNSNQSSSLMERMAKKANGRWLTQTKTLPGYPYFILCEKYVVPAATAKMVTVDFFDDLILLAKEDWRSNVMMFRAVKAWYYYMTERKGDYYKIGDKIKKEFGFSTWYEMTTLVRLMIEHQWTLDSPEAEQWIIELVLCYKIRKHYGNL